MNIEPLVIDTVEELKLDLKRMRFVSSELDLFIFDLYLNYIGMKGIGAKTGEFEVYHRLMEALKGKNHPLFWDDINVVCDNACEFYKKPELRCVLSIFHEASMLLALSNPRLNELSSFLLSIDKNSAKEQYERYLYNTLYVIDKLYTPTKKSAYAALDGKAVKIISSILNVNDTDIFRDIVSGYGLSTLDIVGTSNAKVELSELSSDVSAFAEMLFIVSEKDNYTISVEDTLFSTEIEKDCADKIFFDPPIRVLGPQEREVIFNDIPLRDSTVSAVLRAASALKDNGIAVLSLPPSFLFGISYKNQEARSYLLKNRLLEAVITLPPCWSNRSIATNLVVLSKKDNKDVTFIDLKNDKQFVMRNGLNDVAVNFILDALSGKMEENAFYCKKPIEEVREKSIVPIAYLKSDAVEYSKEFVSNKLDGLYTKLKELLD